MEAREQQRVPMEPRREPEAQVFLRPELNRDSPDWNIMLRSLMAIWALGATFLLLMLVANVPPGETRLNLVRICVIAFTVLGMLIAGRKRLPFWTPDVCAYVLYLIVGWVIVTYEDPQSPYAFFYLWLSVHSFYFLPWRRAAPQVAFIAIDYALSLWAISGSAFPVMRWTVTVVTTIVIVTMVALLRARVDALVARLAAVARADPLTGLRNRRAYDELIALEIARAERTGHPLALVLGDLDNFKSVNDSFGHPAGDAVLRRVAQQLERTERRIDVALRLGGEEFALVLPNTDADGAHLVAERMRHGIHSGCGTDPVAVTMSFGVACYPDHGIDPETLFRAADTALLAAKARGRDRSVVYSRHLDQTSPR